MARVSTSTSPGVTAMPAPARSSVARASPSTPRTIAHRAAIASNIFEGSTVLNTSLGFSVTSAMSVAARIPGTFSLGTRPVNRTLGRPSWAAAARSASSSAPSPTISSFTAGAAV